jgi:surfeit locus 1 family protein
VAINFGTRRFAPPLFATVLMLIGVALGLRLGLWQLDRADQKRVLLEEFAAGEQQVKQLTASEVENFPRYQTVETRGHYDTEHQVLLDNMPSAAGRAGFRVLTPFQYDDDAWILVDRGWIAMGPTREQLPAIDVDANERTIIGRIDELPRPGMRLTQTASAEARWPRVLNFPEHAQLEQALQRRLASRILLLDPQASDGFERVWTQKAGFGPDRHIAYAVQWFALAATMLIVYLVLNLKRTSHDPDSK